jgi:hypothetical protein
MAKKNQRQCNRIVSDRLMEEEYLLFRPSYDVPNYGIQASKDNKKLNYSVRQLEYDNACKHSPLPNLIYKFEVFDHEKEQQKSNPSIHFKVVRTGCAAGTLPPPLEVRESPSGGACR